ncbi:hypothetical protein EPUS_05273 [Endocarpon pusillum Z07020]|uniref:WH1 domain-containing protein n=1 Tax=Endocarpon pusillum (strain Z07020 / HMAS-L-300199) TaxID=1263415 RepID=U1FTW2_ENDPU|nr:uncharacterized protein EPUS_05273 [Endocarpon pusillum Z07020]ERF68192.1 hypothetical protein EPUS_05273 [Endocarpon pusillum Z07020]
MPSLLSDADKETVKRTVPKASNKIQAVAVARLYVAYPDRSRWTYTGLQGAAVLSNDTVGNTFWIKLVDISTSNRGVIWDQEIYDTFAYNQDRTFFHSFELEECLAGLSFVDEKEAKKFKQKMDDREKNATKATKAQPFGSNAAGGAIPRMNGSKTHSRLGGFGSLLHPHRNSSAPTVTQAQSAVSPSEPVYDGPSSRRNSSGIDLSDPTWKGMLDELLEMGITRDQIEQNADFIKAYVAQKQATEGIDSTPDTVQARSQVAPPPPPPPPPPAGPPKLSPQNTGAASSNRRGPPPAPPPSRRPVGGRQPSPPTPHRDDSPPPPPSPPLISQLRFSALHLR